MEASRLLDRTDIADILSLTPLQEGLLFHHRKDPESLEYFEQFILELSGEIDFDFFKRAWDTVIETNEMLRTVFRWEGVEHPIQIILKRHSPVLRFVNVSELEGMEDTVEAGDLVEKIKIRDRSEGFDLSQVPFRITLCRVRVSRYVMLISYHHILCDGWSNGIILKEFFDAYRSLSRGKKPVVPVKGHFREFIRWLQSRERDKQERFWRSYLSGLDNGTALLGKSAAGGAVRDVKRIHVNLPGPRKKRLEYFINENRLTLAGLFYAAWGHLLQLYCNSRDVVFGTTVSGRSARIKGIEEMVGLFINTIPLRVATEVRQGLKEWLDLIREDLRSREPFESTPLLNIREYSGLPHGEELFNTIIVIENYPVNEGFKEESPLAIDSYWMHETSHYGFTIGIFLGDNEIGIDFKYNRELYEEAFVSRLSNHYVNILSAIAEDTFDRISDIDGLSPAERHQLLTEFNNTSRPYPENQSIPQLFEERVMKSSGFTAVVLGNRHLSYESLNQSANEVARVLLDLGIGAGSIVGILVERSLGLPAVLLGILKAGGAYLPLGMDYPEERLKYMLADSGAELLVTEKGRAFSPPGIRVLEKRSIFGETFKNLSNPGLRSGPGDPVYIIYTSGSTGRPKGVVVEGRGVVNVVSFFSRSYGIARDIRVLQMSEYTFDASVNQIFGTLLFGGVLCMISSRMLTDMISVRAYILRLAIEIINFVPSYLNELLGEGKPLRCLRTVISGADRLDAAVRDRLLEKGYRVFNQYGPTETTIDVLADECSSGRVVYLGKPIDNTRVVILGIHGNLLPLGLVGEICISGMGLSRGYLNSVELTDERFVNTPYFPEGRLYRSGDLGRLSRSGAVEFLGRLDHQVKIRGFRVELSEIESVLLRNEAIKEAVVTARPGVGGDRFLAAYLVLRSAAGTKGERALDPGLAKSLTDYCAEALPQYMIPSHFICLDRLPLTPHGKIDRQALPIYEFGSPEAYVAPENEIEVKLVVIWSEILGIDRGSIGIHSSFFRLGGHSLRAAVLVSRIHRVFDIRMPLAEVFNHPDIRSQAEYIQAAAGDPFCAIRAVETREFYALSPAQKRMFVLHQLDPDSLAYNMSGAVLLEGRTSHARLARVFAALVGRHESLRSSFEVIGGEPVQRIHKELSIELEYTDRSERVGVVIEGLLHDFVVPFDLSRPPLLRVGLIRTGARRHLLLVDMHHIISDAVSMENVFSEFAALYEEKPLSNLRIQYKDYSEWQNHEQRRESFKNQESYWLNRFSEGVPVLILPLDFRRMPEQSFAGSVLNFEWSASETQALKSLALRQGVTLYMLLLAIFTLLLSRLSGQEDIVVGTPTAGRRHDELQPLIGMFVNTLVIRNYPASERTFNEFLKEVGENTLSAFENQDYPFENLVERLGISRNIGRNPIFDVMFMLQNSVTSILNLPGLTLKPYRYENHISKFDLSFDALEREDRLFIKIEYCIRLFRHSTIDRIARYIQNIAAAMLEHPDLCISKFEFISQNEKNQILFDFNNNQSDYPFVHSIYQLFDTQKMKTPYNVAFVGLGAGNIIENEKGSHEIQITYGDVDRRVDQACVRLREKGVRPNIIVGVMIERSLDMMLGTLAVLSAGGVYLPIDPDYPRERVDYMLADSGACLLLTDLRDGPSLLCENYHNLKMTKLPEKGSHFAYVIYTSGSTGSPKGVLVEHRNLAAYLLAFFREFDISSQDIVLQQASAAFDAFVEEFYPVISRGGKVVTCPRSVVIDSGALFDFIIKHRITFISVSPLLMNEINKFPHTGNIRLFISGGDELKTEYISRLLKKGIVYNTYGPTETTVCATYFRCSPEYDTSPPIGKPITNYRVHILDRSGFLVPIGVPGELCIGGSGVSRGYLNNPALTAEKFIDQWYHSGDLARWLVDGNIEFLGRIDNQVKIRGFRIEPEEIENQLLQRDDVEAAVVVDRAECDEERYLVAYVVGRTGRVSDSTSLVSECREFLSSRLPGYMVPSFVVELDQLPLTKNGKLDRTALPAPGTRLKKEAEAPKTELEIRLIEIWSEVLNLERKKIGTADNFFHLGGHSLKGTVLVSKIHRELGVKLPLVELFKAPTIKGLAKYIEGSASEQYVEIRAGEKKDYYGLSSPQKRLYFLHQLEPDQITYNMPGIMELEGILDRQRLHHSFRKLMKRHPSLRTFFQLKGDVPVQRIGEDIEPRLEYRDMDVSDDHLEEIIRAYVYPFDLSELPLWRTDLIKITGDRHILIVDLHHIIADGSSLGILVTDFMKLYDGEELPKLRLNYTDFSQWQVEVGRKESMVSQAEYWLDRFSDEVPLLYLPTDHMRPKVGSFGGSSFTFELDVNETSALNSLALSESITVYMLLLSIFTIWLYRISGQSDMVVGTPVAGRSHADWQSVTGMFVNTLALRLFPAADKPFNRYLKEVKECTLSAFENQEYPFEDLVERLNLTRDVGRNPLFDVVFAMQNMEIPALEIAGLRLKPFDYQLGVSKFDLSFQVHESDSKLIHTVTYRSKLFRAATIERWLRYFKIIVTGVLRQPTGKIASFEILTPEERDRILAEFNQTAMAYPADQTVHSFLEDQAVAFPHHTAVVQADRLVSYGELNKRANLLAGYLRDKGVLASDIIGIMIHRSIELVVGILAVLKAGGAYLPLDPAYPAGRIEFMVQDSLVRIMLTHQSVIDRDPALFNRFGSAEILLLEDEALFRGESSDLKPFGGAEDPLYVIYTSGSTGKPKGVLVRHQGLVNMVNFHRKLYAEKHGYRISQVAGIGFDAMALEIWPCLLGGATLYIVDTDEVRTSPVKMQEWLIRKGINLSFQSTIMAEALLTQPWPSRGVQLQVLKTGGDRLTRYPDPDLPFILHNHYGPTEDTIWTTWAELKAGVRRDTSPPIGKPIGNHQVYILADNLNLQPIGVPGELYIGGEGLAVGYLNRPQLTAEKFIESPFAGGKRLYRSGDLCRWLDDGTIDFLGRVDNQVKIRGFRIELGEIESQLLAHPQVKKAVVSVGETRREVPHQLSAYIVTEADVDDDDLREYLSLKLPDFMIPAHFMRLSKIPLTAHGKIDRKALPLPLVKSRGRRVPPQNGLQQRLTDLMKQILGIESVGITDNFFYLGGHSLAATILANRIRREFAVEFPLTRVFIDPTIKAFADYIMKAKKLLHEDIKPVERREFYPLASAQKRLFFLDQFEHIGTSYNIPIALKVRGRLNRYRLEQTIKVLIGRHETLRTSFHFINNEPVQVIHDSINFTIQAKGIKPGKGGDKSQGDIQTAIIKEFIRPFDLKSAPLLRIEIVQFSGEEQLLLFDIHHIVSDGTSMETLVREFSRLYSGEALPPLRIQYKDFSAWQNDLFRTGKIKKQEEYWLELYSDEIPRLDLPTDYSRPAVMSFEGDNYGFTLTREDSIGFNAIGEKSGATLYMNLLAALNVLLYRYTGQTDIIVGSGIAGRAHADLQPVIGMFVNTLAMRNEPAGEKTYLKFLTEVKERSIQAFENQDMQFEELIERLKVERDPSRNPLFDVCFIVQNFNELRIDSKDLSLAPIEYENITSKFDLTLYAWEVNENVFCSLEYYTGIFSRSTIQRFSRQFLNIIKQVCRNPGTELARIGVLSEEERQILIQEFNQTASEYPRDRTIQHLFEGQVDRIPDHIALILEDESISFAHLDAQSSRLANYLYYGGKIRPDDRVGLLMIRTIDLIVAILGILKAGGAYVPLDSAFPEERIKDMINDAEVEVVVSQKHFIKLLNRLQWECRTFFTFLCLDSQDVLSEEEMEKSALMGTRLWEYVGETATDDITGGGWLSSYTGQPIPGEEMEEYGENILKKLTPLLHRQMRVLEIGCASGISMYRLAPKVGFYYGTDLSTVIIDKNRRRNEEEGHRNIRLACLPAHEIEKIDEKDFDLVIINSVIQCFHGHNYLRRVIRQSVGLLKEQGYLFIGDVMDQDLKEALIDELTTFKRTHRDKNFKTKTDWSTELFLSRRFFEDLIYEIPGIGGVEFSDKIFTIENELTKFRYDALITVEKNRQSRPSGLKHKYQHDERDWQSFDCSRIKPPAGPGHLAYIMYTSGSTGKSKGTLISHYNIVRVVKETNYIDLSRKDCILQLSNYAFDGSVFDIYGALLNGIRLVMVKAETVLAIDRLADIIKRENVTVFFVTTALFNAIVDLNIGCLQRVRKVLFGGERISVDHSGRALAYMGRSRIIHVYGPTETTVFASYYFLDAIDERSNTIPIGRPIANTTLYILDPYMQPVPIGVAGEIYIGGDGLSRGYLNKPDLTHSKFTNSPFLENERLYKTGDLARRLADGNIEFLGRIDDQVKLRGFRIELGEIESHLLKHDDIKEALVTLKESPAGDQRHLVSYIVTGRPLEITELREYLSLELPDFMIPAYIVQMEAFPLTPNGKIDRRILPEPESTLSVDGSVPPRDALERKLVEIWAEILGLDRGLIGIDTNFFELGGHSLKATTLVSRIYKELDVKVPLAEIFKTPTVEGLAVHIRSARKDEYVSIEAVEKREYYALSSAQKRIYILQQMDTAVTHYNIPDIFLVEGQLDMKRLEDSFNRLIRRHESLRTSFRIIDGQPQQYVHEAVDFGVAISDLTQEYGTGESVSGNQVNAVADRIIDDFIRPFQLSQAPLLRLGVIKLDINRHILMIDMHHIISDGVSMGILVTEFKTLFRNESLVPLALQYKEFTLWQNRLFQTGEIKKQEAYWTERFKGTLPSLNLPTDYPRPDVQGFRGDLITFQADKRLALQLAEITRSTGTTLYIVLLAAYYVLLFQYTGQQDIVLGSPIAGRVHPDLERVIGMFANTLALRNYPGHQLSFRRFLEDVKQNTLRDYENQDYQFEMLVDQLRIKRLAARNPLFDAVFALQNVYSPEIDIAELKVIPYKHRHRTTHFDIFLEGFESQEGFNFLIEYSTDLFRKETIEKMGIHYLNILRSIVDNSELKISEIDIRSQEEMQQISGFSDFNEGEDYEFD